MALPPHREVCENCKQGDCANCLQPELSYRYELANMRWGADNPGLVGGATWSSFDCTCSSCEFTDIIYIQVSESLQLERYKLTLMMIDTANQLACFEVEDNRGITTRQLSRGDDLKLDDARIVVTDIGKIIGDRVTLEKQIFKQPT